MSTCRTGPVEPAPLNTSATAPSLKLFLIRGIWQSTHENYTEAGDPHTVMCCLCLRIVIFFRFEKKSHTFGSPEACNVLVKIMSGHSSLSCSLFLPLSLSLSLFLSFSLSTSLSLSVSLSLSRSENNEMERYRERVPSSKIIVSIRLVPAQWSSLCRHLRTALIPLPPARRRSTHQDIPITFSRALLSSSAARGELQADAQRIIETRQQEVVAVVVAVRGSGSERQWQ